MNDRASGRTISALVLSLALFGCRRATPMDAANSEPAKSAEAATPPVAAIGPFKVSVLKSLSLPDYRVPAENNPFLGAAAYTSYNLALVLQVTSTAPGGAKLTDKQLTVQVVDDTKARHDALGYIPLELRPAESNARLQTSVVIDPKTNAVTMAHIYTLSNGVTVNVEEVIGSDGNLSWTLEIPPGQPTIVSCIFNLPSDRKAVRAAIAGANVLIPLPAAPPAAR